MKASLALLILLLTVCKPVTAGVDLSSPKSAAKSFYEAVGNGDGAAMRDCLLIDGDQQQQLAGVYVDVILAGKRLADASKDKFGPTGDKIAAGALNREDATSIDKAKQTDTGDDSTLAIDSRARPLKFRKTQGGWKLILIDYAGAKVEAIPDQLKVLASLAAAMNDTADDITAGRFPTPADAEAAIQQRFSEVMVKRYKPASSQPASQP